MPDPLPYLTSQLAEVKNGSANSATFVVLGPYQKYINTRERRGTYQGLKGELLLSKVLFLKKSQSFVHTINQIQVMLPKIKKKYFGVEI